jgi:hypothetical protein
MGGHIDDLGICMVEKISDQSKDQITQGRQPA